MQTHFPPEERLDILKAADGERKWYSLDDKRICTICERIFSGHQVEIQRDEHGRYFLACPTPGCPSTINHWFLREVSISAINRAQPEFSFLEPS